MRGRQVEARGPAFALDSHGGLQGPPGLLQVGGNKHRREVPDGRHRGISLFRFPKNSPLFLCPARCRVLCAVVFSAVSMTSNSLEMPSPLSTRPTAAPPTVVSFRMPGSVQQWIISLQRAARLGPRLWTRPSSTYFPREPCRRSLTAPPSIHLMEAR